MRVAERLIEKEGALDGERVGMTIDMGALAHIMSVLTDLYSDPEAAIIREYATNALDAHVVAGVTRPIEVTLPTPLSPFLRIRDYGEGLDAGDIRDIYSRYGASTKRESDDAVGMLGLGCKSALTYTDQFTLTGTKGGVMTQVSIGRDEDGSGSMTIVAQHATTGESGVEVTIPAKRGNSLEQKARDFFRFWTPGSVLVNGEHPARIDGVWLTDRLLVTDETATPGVVMGNVFYPLPVERGGDSELLPSFGRVRYQRRWGVAFVDIGEVNFTPSREALQMTRRTRETLDRVREEMQRTLNTSLKASIEKAESPLAALDALEEGRVLGFSGLAVYDGHEVVSELSQEDVYGAGYLLGNAVKQYGGYRMTGEWVRTVGLTQSKMGHARANTLGERVVAVFENFDGATYTEVKRGKIAHRLRTDHPGKDVSLYLAVQNRLTKTERYWLKARGCLIYDWTSVKDTVVPGTGPGGTRKAVTGSYTVGRPTVGGGRRPVTEALATEIPQDDTVVWKHGNRWDIATAHETYRGLVGDDVWVVALAANRIEKFKRDFPNAVEIRDHVKRKAKEVLDSLDPDDLEAVRLQRKHGVRYVPADLPVERLDDPDFKEWRRLAAKDVQDVRQQVDSLQGWVDFTLGEYGDPMRDRYPLMVSGTYRSANEAVTLEHLVLYINAAYAAFNKEDA